MSIKTNKIIELSECNLETKNILTGTLLKWMDIIACLAAEKHANVACVTASVDDLQLTKTILLGQVVILKAWINRVFNTSMEVEVCVSSEDVSCTERHKICQAYFTFVTQLDANGKKQYVKPLEPVTEAEKIQFMLANERKKMRLDYKASLKKMKEGDSFDARDISFEEGVSNIDINTIDPKSTYCECVEIVLPQHANHHATTFGGQLMAWMEATATISARRLCHRQPRLVALDEVFFRAPSKVGDRIKVKSQVNNTFEKSMEVGVRVEAYAVGGETRHIQSAYFTFVSPDEHGNPLRLPKIMALDKESYCRMIRAEARVKMRKERRVILSASDHVFSVAITKYNQKILSYKNILALMELYNSTSFKLKMMIDQIRLYQCKVKDTLCIKVECEIDVPPSAAYKVLSDHKKRKFWDMAVTEVTVEEEIRKDEDYILHYVMQNLSPKENVKGDDFVVLASTRKDSRDTYTIAYRSVKASNLPPLPEFNRVEVRCAGFIMEPLNTQTIKGGCRIIYINQLTPHVYEYVKSDLKGATDSFAKRAIALMELIKENT